VTVLMRQDSYLPKCPRNAGIYGSSSATGEVSTDYLKGVFKMKMIYILQDCSDSWTNPIVIGAFTSKAKLVQAIKKNAARLDVWNCEGFREACKDFTNNAWHLDGSAFELSEYLGNGRIAEYPANEIMQVLTVKNVPPIVKK